MKINIGDNEMTFADFPVYSWILFALILIIGSTTVLIFFFRGESGDWLGVLFGVIFVAAAVFGILTTHYRKVSINRRQKTLTIEEIGIFHKRRMQYQTKEVQKFTYDGRRADGDSENLSYYTISAILINGKSIALNSPMLLMGKERPSKEEC
jgi:hypothetical protein